MQNTAGISVGISTLDRPDELARCLAALLCADVRPCEVIVVDQGTDPRTQDVVIVRRDCGVPIKYVRQSRDGLVASRNAVLRIAKGDVVAVTDDDCVPGEGWIAALARVFHDFSDVAAVTGPVLGLNPESEGLYAVSLRPSLVRHRYSGKIGPWLVGTGANVAVRREWVQRVGPYDPRLGTGSPGAAGEDMDMIYRLLTAGALVQYEPNAVVFHELQDYARARATHFNYGHGIGACCALWLRRRDPYALCLLVGWLYRSSRMLLGSLAYGRWVWASQQTRFLVGLLRGLFYGMRA